MSQDKLGHDVLICKYFEVSDYFASYIHDIFKGLFPAGRAGKESKCSIRNKYHSFDLIASKAEQDGRFTEENKSVHKLLENLPACIVNPFTLSPIAYLSNSDGEIRSVEFRERFDSLSEYVREFLQNKFGSLFTILLDKIRTRSKLCIDEFSVLVDSIRFFSQRSWISGNDISILGHLKGALMASLGNVCVLEFTNPFSYELKYLKDLEGIYSITRVFLYYLSNYLFETLDQNYKNYLEILVDLDNAKSECTSTKGIKLYNEPLIDFFTPFVISADHEKIRIFYLQDKIEDVKEGIRRAFENSVNEILSHFQLNNGEVKVNFEVQISRLKCNEIKINKNNVDEAAKILNDFLTIDNNILMTEVHQLTANINGLPTSTDLCEACKRRPAVALDENMRKEIENYNVLKEGEKLCNVCLAVRLSSLYLGRVSTPKIGDKLVQGDQEAQKSLEEKGWSYLFETDEERGRSIDELTTRDAIFVVLKLNLNKWNDREVELEKYYSFREQNQEYDYLNNLRALERQIGNRVTIPKSLDREFSFRSYFSLLAEQFLALIYLNKIPQIMLVFPSMATPLAITVIRKEDLKTLWENVIYKFLKPIDDGISPVPQSLLVYLIRAKTFTPIQLIMKILEKEDINAENNKAVSIIPVIAERGKIPNTPLIAFTLDEVNEEIKKLQDVPLDALANFFVSSAEDMPYPAFQDYEKLEGKLNLQAYIQQYYRQDRRPFSITFNREDILRAYIAGLLK